MFDNVISRAASNVCIFSCSLYARSVLRPRGSFTVALALRGLGSCVSSAAQRDRPGMCEQLLHTGGGLASSE